jgi:hypothetical protein
MVPPDKQKADVTRLVPSISAPERRLYDNELILSGFPDFQSKYQVMFRLHDKGVIPRTKE